MYNRIETILEAYPYEFAEIRKGRGAHLCTDTQGRRMIVKEFPGTLGKAEALDRFLNYLQGRGWDAEQVLATKEGQLLAYGVEDTRFYMRSWVDGRECDTRSREEICQALRQLARLHLVTAGYGESLPDTFYREELKTRYQRYTKELRKVYRYIQGRKRKNEFEAAFLLEYRHYLDQAQEVQRSLEELGEADCAGCIGICHGDFHHHNVLVTGKGMRIVNYDHFCVDAYVSDLVNFFRKIMEKQNWKQSIGTQMLSAYEEVRPLSSWERRQFYLRMAYPEKFRKVANHYANTKKSWANHRDLEKLQKLVAQERERMDFLKSF